jgi:hypothetical protein
MFVLNILHSNPSLRVEYRTLLGHSAGAQDFPSPLMGEGQGEGVVPQGDPLSHSLPPGERGKRSSFSHTAQTVVWQALKERSLYLHTIFP